MTRRDPEKGMPVTWITSDDHHTSLLIGCFRTEYGSSGLTVDSARLCTGSWVVTLSQNGKPLLRKERNRKESVREFEWQYLRPAE